MFFHLKVRSWICFRNWQRLDGCYSIIKFHLCSLEIIVSCKFTLLVLTMVVMFIRLKLHGNIPQWPIVFNLADTKQNTTKFGDQKLIDINETIFRKRYNYSLIEMSIFYSAILKLNQWSNHDCNLDITDIFRQILIQIQFCEICDWIFYNHVPSITFVYLSEISWIFKNKEYSYLFLPVQVGRTFPILKRNNTKHCRNKMLFAKST